MRTPVDARGSHGMGTTPVSSPAPKPCTEDRRTSITHQPNILQTNTSSIAKMQ